MTGYVYRGATRDLGLDLEQANRDIMDARDGTGRDTSPGFEWRATRQRRLADDACGTDAGYKRHRKHHEPRCDACWAAHNAANQDRKARRRAAL